jgi:AraC-like DNA-binding protein
MDSAPGDAPHVGHFVPWNGGCLLIGRAGRVIPTHAHYAIQIAFGTTAGIRFRTTEADAWTEYVGAIIPSRQPHAMDATHVQPNAVLLIEPETREGRALTERHLRTGIAPIPAPALEELGPALFSAWSERRSTHAVAEAAQRVVGALAGGVAPSVASDERVLRAVRYIHAHVGGPLTLTMVADEACLSPHRFRHLFVEQTGMALRPYILWRRMLRAWELLTAGGSLSAAAHDAGFADAAHLSRTSRRMFGFPPSAIRFAEPLPASSDGAPAPPGTAPGAAPFR